VGHVQRTSSNGRCTPASGVARLERLCGRATPDAPERVYDQRRCTRGYHRTSCRGSRGSASLPSPNLNRQTQGPLRRNAVDMTAQRLQSKLVQLTVILDSSDPMIERELSCCELFYCRRLTTQCGARPELEQLVNKV